MKLSGESVRADVKAAKEILDKLTVKENYYLESIWIKPSYSGNRFLKGL